MRAIWALAGAAASAWFLHDVGMPWLGAVGIVLLTLWLTFRVFRAPEA